MIVPKISVYSKETEKYLGTRSIHSRMDKSVKHGEGRIKYYVIWKGKEIFFKPNEEEVYV
jgi:hypothetical protein